MKATLLGRLVGSLVQEMTAARVHHHQPCGIAGGNRVAISFAATGLDYSANASFSSQLDGVIEGKKTVAG